MLRSSPCQGAGSWRVPEPSPQQVPIASATSRETIDATISCIDWKPVDWMIASAAISDAVLEAYAGRCQASRFRRRP